jgi:hypothetical protein
MITLSIILIILVIISIYDPYIDCFYDYRGKYHIILWYNDNEGQRKYINIIGNQER